MKAWRTYWLTLAVGAVLWIGIALVAGRDGVRTAPGQPITAAILLAPIFLAGLNLIAFRQTHEVVCRIGGGTPPLVVSLGWAGVFGEDVRVDWTCPRGAGRRARCVGCERSSVTRCQPAVWAIARRSIRNSRSARLAARFAASAYAFVASPWRPSLCSRSARAAWNRW